MELDTKIDPIELFQKWFKDAQEKETRKLIKHLGLDWEDACISPHKNKRSVRTASQQQVRQKVYQGSSKVWQKYEPFLNGAFDSLISFETVS